MKITVPPEIERALTAQARKLGTTAELIALDSLRERFVRSRAKRRRDKTQGNARKTLADFLKGYVGVLHAASAWRAAPGCPKNPERSLPER